MDNIIPFDKETFDQITYKKFVKVLQEMVHNAFHIVNSIDTLTDTLWYTIPVATHPAINNSTRKHWIQWANKLDLQQGRVIKNKSKDSNSDKIDNSAIKATVTLYRGPPPWGTRKTRNQVTPHCHTLGQGYPATFITKSASQTSKTAIVATYNYVSAPYETLQTFRRIQGIS